MSQILSWISTVAVLILFVFLMSIWKKIEETLWQVVGTILGMALVLFAWFQPAKEAPSVGVALALMVVVGGLSAIVHDREEWKSLLLGVLVAAAIGAASLWLWMNGVDVFLIQRFVILYGAFVTLCSCRGLIARAFG